MHEVEERGGGVGGAAVEERRGAEAAEGGVEVAEALGEPPAGDAAGEVGALLLGGPHEDGDDVAGADGGGEGGVVFDAEVAPEPDDAARGRGRVMAGAGLHGVGRGRHQSLHAAIGEGRGGEGIKESCLQPHRGDQERRREAGWLI